MANPVNILSAAQATGAGSTILCKGWINKYLTVTCAGTLENSVDTIVVKIKGSSQESAPDFDAAQSATNEWDFIKATHKDAGTAINGSTGMTFEDGGTYDVGTYLLNLEADGLNWITVDITTYTDADKSASITVNCQLSRPEC